jgi:alpha-tubulin suppressor-like RCC1 family protein
MIRSGAAYCWGDNTYGELGNNSTMNSNVPVAVNTGGALAGVTLTQISAGNH